MDTRVSPSSTCPDDILTQCATLMANQGYHGTSMRDLARTTLSDLLTAWEVS